MKRRCLPNRNRAVPAGQVDRAVQEVVPQAAPVAAPVIGLPAKAVVPAVDPAAQADSVLRQSLSRLNKSD